MKSKIKCTFCDSPNRLIQICDKLSQEINSYIFLYRYIIRNSKSYNYIELDKQVNHIQCTNVILI